MTPASSARAARTRALVQETAMRLFARQGYDATTVAQIAREAGVSHMTFFRHFPTKDAVVLDDGFDPAIAAAVAATDVDVPPLARVCAGLRAALADLRLPDERQVRQRVRLASAHPGLRAGMWANTDTTREALVDVLVADGGDPFAARVAAAAALAAVTVALQDWCLAGEADSPEGSLGERLGAALDLLQPGAPR